MSLGGRLVRIWLVGGSLIYDFLEEREVLGIDGIDGMGEQEKRAAPGNE